MLSGKSVLFVDDEPGIRLLGLRALRAAGAQAYEGADGDEAIAILDRMPIDLVVIDIIMPDREGVETISEIRKRWPDVKVIAISGGGRVAAEDFLKLAAMVGADATMKKPMNFKDLVALIGNLLQPAAA